MKVLVTGATSLLGRAVATGLVAQGSSVVTLQRRASEVDGTRCVQGSILEPEIVATAMQGCDAVIHLAARVGIVGTWDQFHDTNVIGTEIVVTEAERAGVSGMVYVSSPSVAHGGEPLIGASAGEADPGSSRGHYATSKALAEGFALSRHEKAMQVTAVRPHLVWGPGDTQLVGRIVERARKGRLAFVGTGAALIDSTYISNAADAIIAAVDRIDHAGGRPLVVSNGEPRPIAELVNGILSAHGLPPVSLRLPKAIAFGAGWVAERVWDRARLNGEPPMTTFLAEQLGTAHWFDQQETRRILNWKPAVTVDEGLERLAAHAKDKATEQRAGERASGGTNR